MFGVFAALIVFGGCIFLAVNAIASNDKSADHHLKIAMPLVEAAAAAAEAVKAVPKQITVKSTAKAAAGAQGYFDWMRNLGNSKNNSQGDQPDAEVSSGWSSKLTICIDWWMIPSETPSVANGAAEQQHHNGGGSTINGDDSDGDGEGIDFGNDTPSVANDAVKQQHHNGGGSDEDMEVDDEDMDFYTDTSFDVET